MQLAMMIDNRDLVADKVFQLKLAMISYDATMAEKLFESEEVIISSAEDFQKLEGLEGEIKYETGYISQDDMQQMIEQMTAMGINSETLDGINS